MSVVEHATIWYDSCSVLRHNTDQTVVNHGEGRAMLEVLLQCLIIGVWGATLTIHMRRLMRLARLRAPALPRDPQLRRKLERAWWWLGREEFWRGMQADLLQALQLSLLIVILGWGWLA
jgi:hypothetical protein